MLPDAGSGKIAPMLPPPITDVRDAAFAAVSAAFGSLGRVCMALDAEFRVRHVSSQLDALLGPGAAARIGGHPIETVLGPELFAPGSPLREALLAGEKREGWRALLRGEGGATRLLSITAAPLKHDAYGVCDPNAVYLLVMRPAEDDPAWVTGHEPTAGSGLLCRSPAMARVLRLVETLQHSEASILITGDSGTGKEVLARALHAHSPRRNGPFVAVNAAALPGELLESELFGHVRGAFTGAVRDRSGRFELANDGTLFLDEVGDVPLHLQVKLLRVLQERSYERVGEAAPRQTNARIIAATHRDLRTIYLLSRSGARTGRSLRFSPEALRALLTYDWPGNVRELENALEFAATVCQGQTLQPEDLPPELQPSASRPAAPSDTPWPVIVHAPVGPPATEDERRSVKQALEANRWSRAETARALGMSRSTLWRRMRALGLE